MAPHQETELVQASLDHGMSLLDPCWQRGDPPYLLGAIPADWTRAVAGKLSWHRPWGRCHWIAFFSMAIGVLNHPSLDWRFVSGDLHTVPVGYGPGGDPQGVMDILLFERMSAEESIAHAMKKLDAAEEGDGLESYYEAFVRGTVPLLRASARAG